MKKINFYALLIILTAFLLRIGLGLYNRDANDPHMPVIRFLIRNGELPDKSDCWECFQPKLFHYTAAKVLIYLHMEMGGDNQDNQKIIIQMLNGFAGLITMFFAWMFINTQSSINDNVKLLTLSLAAFNQQLIGINSQVTNDTFAILFCVLAVYFAWSYLHRQTVLFYALTICFSVLAILTKTNSWIIIIAITLSFFCTLLPALPGRIYKALWVVTYPIVTTCIIFIVPISQYSYNAQKYGSPILLNIDRQETPPMFGSSYIPFAGILSIPGGFFTFRLINLIESPITPLTEKIESNSHRTSLWTRLYGSANSVHFENYPPSWRISGKSIYWLLRGIYILALLPMIILLAGTARGIQNTIKGFRLKDGDLLMRNSFGLFTFLFVGYILFAAFYAFQYRIYTVMKAVFLYPGLLSYLYFFMQSLNYPASGEGFFGRCKREIFTLLFTLMLLQITDILILLIQLYYH